MRRFKKRFVKEWRSSNLLCKRWREVMEVRYERCLSNHRAFQSHCDVGVVRAPNNEICDRNSVEHHPCSRKERHSFEEAVNFHFRIQILTSKSHTRREKSTHALRSIRLRYISLSFLSFLSHH